jgi:hypothetical protein
MVQPVIMTVLVIIKLLIYYNKKSIKNVYMNLRNPELTKNISDKSSNFNQSY